MKCFNLTDVETPDLLARGLVNVVLVVRTTAIKPGESAEVAEDSTSRRDVANYVKVGALAVESLPITYVVQKNRLTRSPVEVTKTRAPKGRK